MVQELIRSISLQGKNIYIGALDCLFLLLRPMTSHTPVPFCWWCYSWSVAVSRLLSVIYGCSSSVCVRSLCCSVTSSSRSCLRKPQLGMMRRRLFTVSTASTTVMSWHIMRYARNSVADLLRPITQCTSSLSAPGTQHSIVKLPHLSLNLSSALIQFKIQFKST